MIAQIVASYDCVMLALLIASLIAVLIALLIASLAPDCQGLVSRAPLLPAHEHLPNGDWLGARRGRAA
jgi:hypothetical protein